MPGFRAPAARRRPGLPRQARRRAAHGRRSSWSGSAQLEVAARRGAACPTPALVREAAAQLARAYDAQYGGIGQAPKFPNTGGARALPARRATPTGEPRFSEMVAATRCAAWRRAASTTSSAAASTATRSTSAGWCRTSRRCSTTTPSSCRSISSAYQVTGDAFFATHRARDARLRRARDARSGGRLLLDPGRRQRGRGGQVLRLGRARGACSCSARRSPSSPAATGTSPTSGNFEHRNILHVTLEVEQLAKLLRARRSTTVRAQLAAGARHAVRGARAARQARASTTRC